MHCGFQIVLAVILASLPAVASADIIQWTDEAGVTHYTNLKGEVPSQQAVQVVVDEQVWLPQGPPLEAVPEAKADPVAAVVPMAPPDPPRDTEDEVLRAYVAGLDSGLAANAGTGGSVYINGPLAVTIAPPPSYGGYMPSEYGWLPPGYSPFLTTAVIARPRGPLRGRTGSGFRGGFPSPPSISAAGPPPIGAAGPPPIGAAGRPPVGAAGRPPVGAAGGRLIKVSGSRFSR